MQFSPVNAFFHFCSKHVFFLRFCSNFIHSFRIFCMMLIFILHHVPTYTILPNHVRYFLNNLSISSLFPACYTVFIKSEQ